MSAEQTDADRLAALEAREALRDQELCYLRRRVAMLERALGGIQGAVAVLHDPDDEDQELPGSS